MEQTTIDITKKYLKLIRKKKELFIIVAAIIITVFLVSSYLLPKEYEAKSIVFIERNVINNLVQGIAITPSLDQRLRVLTHAIVSRNLLLKTMDSLDMNLSTKKYADIEKLVRKLHNNTKVEAYSKGSDRDNTDLFIVSFIDQDPKFAKDFVNTLVRLYIEENLSAKKDEAFGANTFLSEQIKFFKDKLDNIDQQIINFRKEKGIYVSINEANIVQEIKDTQEKLEEIGIQKKELEAKKALIEKNIKNEDPYTVAILGTKTSTLNEKIISLQNRLNELLLNYTENYPEVLRIKAEIELLKERLKSGSADGYYSEGSGTDMSALNPMYQELKEELSKTELELESLKVREDYLKKVFASKKEYLREIPSEKKILADLERERDTNKNIYEQLIARLSQSDVSKQMEVQDKSTTFKIVDPAVLPTKPVSPNRPLIIFLGIIAGIACGFGAVYLLNVIDKSIRDIGTLKMLGLPVLAVIPKIVTQDKLMNQRRRDKKTYILTGIFMFFVLSVFIVESISLLSK